MANMKLKTEKFEVTIVGGTDCYGLSMCKFRNYMDDNIIDSKGEIKYCFRTTPNLLHNDFEQIRVVKYKLIAH